MPNNSLTVDPKFRILDLSGRFHKNWSPQEIREEIEKHKKILEECAGSTVGVRLDRSAHLIIVMIALFELKCTIFFESSDTLRPSELVNYSIGYTNERKLINRWAVSNRFEYVKSLLISKTTSEKKSPHELAYVICTSGTTGKPKKVGVPWNAIMPNIEDFGKTFQVSPSDSVLFTTSLSFDPSIVEMFLAIEYGAELIICPDRTRGLPNELSSVLKRNAPTIVQLTPAVISLLPDETLRWVMSDGSPVRILMVGGEQFPLSRLRSIHSQCPSSSLSLRVFNVYGVTEVSCWASIKEVDFSDYSVCLGRPLMNTTLDIRTTEDGLKELLIGGSRCCYIDDKPPVECFATGDLVEETRNGLQVVGRVDDQVKINGVRVNLASASTALSENSDVEWAQFVLYKEEFLVLFVRSTGSVSDHLKSVLPHWLRPAKIIYLNEEESSRIPITNNGKVDRTALCEMLHNSEQNPVERFWKLISKWNITRSYDLSHSFVSFGIDSMGAAEIALELNQSEIVGEILTESISVIDFVGKYLEEPQSQPSSTLPPASISPTLIWDRPPRIVWEYDTKKCIDADPLLMMRKGEHVIVTGSHSGRLACLSLLDGSIFWQFALPDRIEGSMAADGDLFFVGCHDCRLYVVNVNSGAISYKFKTDGIIKTKPVVGSGSETSMIYVASYDRRLYKVDVQNAKEVWRVDVGLVSGEPLLCADQDIILIGNLEKEILALRASSGDTVWNLSTSGPIFSPIMRDGDFVIVCAVDGQIAKIRINCGSQIVSRNLAVPIFASAFKEGNFYIISTQNGEIVILQREDLSIVRRYSMENAHFVKPLRRRNEDFLQMTTNGEMIVLDNSLIPIRRCRLADGEIFSQILIPNNDLLVFGCRDDKLRCVTVGNE